VITKVFHFTKDFRQIRGKSFVIMDESAATLRLSGHNRQVPGPTAWAGRLDGGNSTGKGDFCQNWRDAAA
jgi:hypothetical protein